MEIYQIVLDWKTILLRWQYSPNWSMDSMEFWKKIPANLFRNWEANHKIHKKIEET